MRSLFALSAVFLAVLSAFSVVGCGIESSPKRRGRVDPSGLNGVNDLTGNHLAAAAIAAQTETENGRAPGDCLQILLSDAKDIYVVDQDETSWDKSKNVFCAMTESQQTHMFTEAHRLRGSRNNQPRFFMDALTSSGKFTGRLNYENGSVTDYSDAMASQDASMARDILCSDRSKDEYREAALQSFKSVVSPMTMDKFNACVSSRSYGLKCKLDGAGDDVKVTLRWEPTELVRSFLPMVALTVQPVDGAAVMGDAPKTVGVGSGVVVPLKISDGFKGAIFSAQAQDRGGNFNFSCQASFADLRRQAEPAKVYGPHESCGVELYAVGTGEICGPKSFKPARSPQCAPEIYRSSRGPECGVESYNQKHDCAICGQAGPWGGCKQCASPAFGVASYKECRRASFGVELFSECRAPSHGVEEWQSCRDRQFGVEKYRSCEHY
jgi:hypothetical protein